MKRTLFLVAAVSAAATAWSAWRRSPDASAVDASQVVGTYKLKLKGDGWLRGSQDPYEVQRVSGAATLVLSRHQPDDGRLHVEIRLPAKDTGGLVDKATPNPAFVGDAFLIGDSMAVIDSGGPTFVNALTLEFVKDGAHIVGHWLAAYPATDAASGPASAVGIDLTGRRTALPTRVRVAR